MTPAEVAAALKSLSTPGKFAPLPANGPPSIQYQFTYDVTAQPESPQAKRTTAQVAKILRTENTAAANVPGTAAGKALGATAGTPAAAAGTPCATTASLPGSAEPPPGPATGTLPLLTIADSVAQPSPVAIAGRSPPTPDAKELQLAAPYLPPPPAGQPIKEFPALGIQPVAVVSLKPTPASPQVLPEQSPAVSVPLQNEAVPSTLAASPTNPPAPSMHFGHPTEAALPSVRIVRPPEQVMRSSVRVVRPTEALAVRAAHNKGSDRDIMVRRRGVLDNSSFLLGDGKASHDEDGEIKQAEDPGDTIKPTVRTVVVPAKSAVDVRGRDPSSIIAMASSAAKLGDTDKAVDTLTEGLKVHPNNYELMMRLGSTHEQRGELTSAAAQYEQAAPLPSDDPSAYLKLIHIYKEVGDSESEARTWTTFNQRYPYQSLSADVKKQVDAFKDKMADIRLKAEQGNPEQSEYRWPDSTMPLKVCIPAQFDPPAFKSWGKEITGDEASALIREALDEWARATDGKISYVYCAEEKEANLTFGWTTDRANLKAESAVGVTFMGKTQRPIIVLSREYYDKTRPISNVTFYAVTLHEIGHGLGLMHSPDRADIMYPGAIPRAIRGLSKNDIARVRKLYGVVRD